MRFRFLLLIVLLAFLAERSFATDSSLAGKDLFYNLKSKNGTCNTCHPGGRSAGRWNPTTKEISQDEGKKIPSLKGIGKKKNPEQIQRSIELMKKMSGFKLTNEQMEQLVEYVGTL